jgi:hypothetical protein
MLYNISATNAEVLDIILFTLQKIIVGIWGQTLLSWPPNFNVNFLEIDIKILPFTVLDTWNPHNSRIRGEPSCFMKRANSRQLETIPANSTRGDFAMNICSDLPGIIHVTLYNKCMLYSMNLKSFVFKWYTCTCMKIN